jgi:hypothetical protein
MFSVSNFIKVYSDVEFQAYGLADGAILIGVLTGGNGPEGWYSVGVLEVCIRWCSDQDS